MARFSRFGEVADLDDDALRALLGADGDEPERVWAAWALAVRGQLNGKLFGDAAKDEPAAGVRAHFALMLVATGERSAALVLARRDPDALVRESAWRYLARTVAPNDDALNDALATALAMERSPSVRAAILDGLPNAVCPLVRARALALLEHESRDVCATAVDFIVRRDDEDLVSLFVARAPHVDGHLFRTMIDACASKRSTRALLDATAAWPPHATIRLLDALAATHLSLTAADIESLFAREEDTLDIHLAKLDARGIIELPLKCVLDVALRHSFYDASRLCARLDALAELSAEERPLVEQLIAAIERTYDALEHDVPVTEALARIDHDDDDRWPWIPQVDVLPALWRARDRLR